jgi:hypothetical protein
MKRKQALLLFVFILFISVASSAQPFENFITASGNKLMDGKKEFRFISYNIPNLNYVEDELAFSTTSPFRFPTEFEIRDALATIKQMGGRVVRNYTFPVKRSDQSDKVPTYVLAPGKFDEDAFKVNDMVLAIANEMGIRVIFPIVNAWKWMGGRPQYAAFRGKTEEDFWTDPQLIADVEKTIDYVINRTNTITGVKYKDDKAIFCWETGNELPCPVSWAVTISRYIKQLDKNHLVMDGYSRPVRKEILDEPSIDIVNTHHYEVDPQATIEHIKQNLATIGGRKPYIIGEFGFQGTYALANTMDFIIKNKDIAGGMIWSLRSHREEGGFYWHTEPFGMGIYKAYHWPGFASGHSYDEIAFNDLICRKAFEIQGLTPPAVEKPASPKLLDIKDAYDINWQGSAGASLYDIERAEKPDGPWELIAKNVDDASVQYTALFQDKTAEIGKAYYYRVTAVNIAGRSNPSNVVGPVKIATQAIIDDMSNYGDIYLSKDVTLATGEDRKFKEDIYRMAGKKGSEITYYVPGKLKAFKVYSFEKTPENVLTVSTSIGANNFKDTKTAATSYYEKNDYGSWYPVLYEVVNPNPGTNYIKITFKDIAQISRVEIIYD